MTVLARAVPLALLALGIISFQAVPESENGDTPLQAANHLVHHAIRGIFASS